MAKYLLQGSYTVEGLRGVLREGGTKRREAVAQLVQALGVPSKPFIMPMAATIFSSLPTCRIV
jgi:hypothetical protein